MRETANPTAVAGPVEDAVHLLFFLKKKHYADGNVIKFMRKSKGL